jgi:pimeloyl-ACP methyl ester carboxylesterase
MGFAHTRAGKVAYQERGEGPPLLLLHATLHDRHDFDPIIEQLAEHYRTIAIDWPGHGESELTVEPSAPLFADVLEDIIDGLGLSRLLIIGNSVGGFAAARLAIVRPDAVAGLVLVNNGGFVRLNSLTRAYCRILGTPTIFRLAAASLVRSYMKAETDNDDSIVDRVLTKSKTPEGVRTATALWRSFATPEHDLRDRAKDLVAPTLIVWGNRDTAIPISAGRTAHDAIKGSRFEELATGHVVFSSDPEGFLAITRPFLASIHTAL